MREPEPSANPAHSVPRLDSANVSHLRGRAMRSPRDCRHGAACAPSRVAARCERWQRLLVCGGAATSRLSANRNEAILLDRRLPELITYLTARGQVAVASAWRSHRTAVFVSPHLQSCSESVQYVEVVPCSASRLQVSVGFSVVTTEQVNKGEGSNVDRSRNSKARAISWNKVFETFFALYRSVATPH